MSAGRLEIQDLKVILSNPATSCSPHISSPIFVCNCKCVHVGVLKGDSLDSQDNMVGEVKVTSQSTSVPNNKLFFKATLCNNNNFKRPLQNHFDGKLPTCNWVNCHCLQACPSATALSNIGITGSYRLMLYMSHSNTTLQQASYKKQKYNIQCKFWKSLVLSVWISWQRPHIQLSLFTKAELHFQMAGAPKLTCCSAAAATKADCCQCGK